MLEYCFTKPILFSGYRIKTADDAPEADPKDWKVYVDIVNKETEVLIEENKLIASVKNEE